MNSSLSAPVVPANHSRRFVRCSLVSIASLAVVAIASACSSIPDPDPAAANGAASVEVDQTEIVAGVTDEGKDPAVVALDIGGTELCSATLIAPDVLLTARHCVSETAEEIACPPTGKQVTANRPASAFHVLLGDDVATAKEVAGGKQVLTPSGSAICDEDIALILLDREVPGIDPLVVSATGIAKGGHVTAIGYGRRGDGDSAGKKLLREHVAVLATSAAEFLVGEATCQGDSGGPALDEATGEIVGVVSRGGPTCDGVGVHNIYTRADAFRALVDEALAKSASHGKKPKPKADAGGKAAHDPIGGSCKKASDCASGLCAKDHGKTYCSRTCDAADRCPAHYHCTVTGTGAKACIAQP